MSLLVDYGRYTPGDIDSEMMLSQMPLEILEDNIQRQFEEPFEFRKIDYLSSFLTTYHYTKKQLEVSEEADIEEEKEELESLRTEFISFMNRVFDQYLDISFPEINDMGEDDQDEILHFTYRFFITNIRHNFVNLVLNYIEKYKKDICEFAERKKDVSTQSFKREITDPDDILILSNLNDILSYILSREYTVESFLELTERSEPVLEKCLVDEWYDNWKITGNFIEKYFRMVTKGFMIDMECRVRHEILKKYTKLI